MATVSRTTGAHVVAVGAGNLFASGSAYGGIVGEKANLELSFNEPNVTDAGNKGGCWAGCQLVTFDRKKNL